MATDEDIEREILAKGLTAPRVSSAGIEAKIKSEHYFTAGQGLEGTNPEWVAYPTSLGRLTICILVLENGFTILGKSAPASAANFDAELGKKIARADAFNQIWPLEGYLLREQLFAREPSPTERELIGGSVEADAVYRFAGWLSTLPDAVTIGASHEAGSVATLVDQFLNVPRSNAFMERVIYEEAQLSANLAKLSAFINGDTFPTLAAETRGQLQRQESAMEEYRNVLSERIAAHKSPPMGATVGVE